MNEKDLEAFRDLIDSIHPSYKTYNVSYLKEMFPQEFQAFEAGCSHSKKEGQTSNKEVEKLEAVLAISEELSKSKDKDIQDLKKQNDTAAKALEEKQAALQDKTEKLEKAKKQIEGLQQDKEDLEGFLNYFDAKVSAKQYGSTPHGRVDKIMQELNELKAKIADSNAKLEKLERQAKHKAESSQTAQSKSEGLPKG